jgi:hypothetical protein
MAGDRRLSNAVPVPDVRRRVALRAYSLFRFLEGVQGALEDVEGAIGEGQYGVAAFQARHVVLTCLSIRSLASGGEIELGGVESVSFDYFAGLTADEVAAALALVNEALAIDERTAGEWFDRLRAYAAATERLLDYARPLPLYRSPAGAFGLIRLVRPWLQLLDELGLPPLLPSDWGSPAPVER